MVGPDRPQLTMWRMRIVFWVPKATNIHSENVTLFDFPVQQWLHESASVLRYTYNACLVNMIRTVHMLTTVERDATHVNSCIWYVL
jgi:hypothetical protein